MSRQGQGAGLSIHERLWPRLDVGDCWEWTGGLNSGGYGSISYEGRVQGVHAVVWQLLVGPVPDGLELDHLCRNRKCCNPDHLEPVPHRVNARRGVVGIHLRSKTECKRGHPFDAWNTVRVKAGRQCRTCRNEQSRLRMQRVREQRKAA